MIQHKTPLLEGYQKNIEAANRQIEQYKQLSFRYSMVRLGIFLLAIPLFYFLVKTTLLTCILSFLLVAVLFVWAVVRQEKYDKLLSESEAYKAINQNEIEVANVQQNLYYNGKDYQIHNHAFCEDLDLFGAYSLYSLINRSRTYFGNQFLKNIFLEAPTPEEVLLRQEAIQELEPAIEWRQSLAVKLFHLENVEHLNVAETIQQHLSANMSFADGQLLKWYRKSLPVVWLCIAALYFFETSLANTLASFFFIGNLLLVGKYTKNISSIQSQLSKVNDSLKGYIEALRVIFSKQWKAKLLSDASHGFNASSKELPLQFLSELSTLIHKLDYRLNFLVAILANGLILWDLRIISYLNKWKKSNLAKIELVFKHIGFMECLSSLATWSFNNPSTCYPKIHRSFLEIEAVELAHPLISSRQRVSNDFKLDSSHHICIITGSNMSGKSTFLRTLAINMVLGYSGAKVMATSLRMPVVQLITYMRIKDALEESVSTFKAELNRIRMILEFINTKENVFIFIDEMLRGTNSKDKLNGSIGITRKLLASKAYAMIATHDIKLAELGNNNNQIANYYFDIDFKNGDLVFDYKLKEGICENFNASFLLNQLGIKTDT